jgi:hypothetical protein
MTWGQADTVFIKYNKDRFEDKPNYKTDTVIFDNPNARQIIYGTTVLPWTTSQQFANNFGISLHSVNSTECNQSEKPNENEVISIVETDTTLKIETKIFGNCCHSFLCDLEIVNGSIINLKFYGYGATYCSCNCCYGITYNIEKWNTEDYKLLQGVMVNGDRRLMKKLR